MTMLERLLPMWERHQHLGAAAELSRRDSADPDDWFVYPLSHSGVDEIYGPGVWDRLKGRPVRTAVFRYGSTNAHSSVAVENGMMLISGIHPVVSAMARGGTHRLVSVPWHAVLRHGICGAYTHRLKGKRWMTD